MNAALFAGRDAELDELSRHLQQGLGGQRSVTFVIGEPGAGKTTLLAEFVSRAQAAHPKLQTAIGKCNAYGGFGDAYLPFKEILRQLTGDVGQSVVERRASSEGASRVREFMQFARQTLIESGPDLVDLFVPGGGLVTKIGGKAVRRLRGNGRPRGGDRATTSDIKPENVLEQYTQVLEAISAKRPLLLVVDDLHWADPGTLGLLFHLAQRLVNDSLLIVGAYRREELLASNDGVAHPLLNVVAELQRQQGAIQVDLDRTNARGFVDALLDRAGHNLDGPFRDALTRHTSGNALFVVELLHSLEQSGVLERDAHDRLTQCSSVTWGTLPSRVAGVVESRLGRLTRTERLILSAAAVQGDDFDAEIVAQVTGDTRRAVVSVLSGALTHEHHLVSASGLRAVGDATVANYRFRHNVVQDYLYQKLDPIESGELHAATGEAIEKLYADVADTFSSVLARHYECAGRNSRALVWRLRSAETAALGCAPSQSIVEFEAALRLQERHHLAWPAQVPDRASVMERLGEQLLLVGRYDDARERFRACIHECELTGAGCEARSQVWRRLAEASERANRYDEALNALDSAQAALGPEPRDGGDTWWHSWIEAELARAGIHYWRNDSVQMATSQQRLEPVVERRGDPLQRGRFQYEIVRQSLRRNRYRADAAMIARARLAVAGLGEHSTRSDEAELLFGLGFAHFWADELEDAKAGMERSLGIAHRIGSVMLKARCLTYLGLVHRRLGREDEVARINDEVREFVVRSGAANYAATTSAQDAWLAWRRHDSRAAFGYVGQAISTWMSKSPGYPVQWPGWWVRVALAFESEDTAGSVDALRSIVAPSQSRPPDDLEDLLGSLVASYDANGSMPPAGMQRALDLARAHGFL